MRPSRLSGKRVARVAGAVAALMLLALTSSAGGEITQQEGLRVNVNGKVSPRTLPRKGLAPIAVTLAGEVSTADGAVPPQLRRLDIEINREGRFDFRGLPVCRYPEIQPATNERALAACRSSLVGQGSFSAYVILSSQAPYATTGRLLLFNGRQHGRPVLLGHIYLAKPFASSVVIPFEIASKSRGSFGTLLRANVAKALGSKRYLTGIELRLSRQYSFAGNRHSYLSAGCPAPAGFSQVNFPLARATFAFAGRGTLTSTVISTCRAR